ncbi:MAG: cell division protein ZapA [Candidatus Zixiibacteriota bacterium]
MSDISDKSQVVSVTIFGEEYPIRGVVEKDHILRVAACVDKKMREIALKSRNRSPGKIAVLAALNLADELLDLKDRSTSDLDKIESRTKNILDLLDEKLPKSNGS